jgi:acylphosphatase
MAKLARRIVVHGRVQGVGFRYFVQRAGKSHGLTGNVRNLPDDTVEIVVEGPLGAVEDFIRDVRKGPRMALVEGLDVHEIAVTDRYSTFMIEGW